MSPKRIALVVIAVTAAMVVVISVIAGAIAALPRQNRYAIGAQSGDSAASSPASTQSTPAPSSVSSATATPTPTEPDLPDPVLAAVLPRVVPDKTAVAAKIRAVKVKGMGASYSGSVVEVGTGKVLYAHNANRGYIPASTMKLLTSTAALSILGPDHTFKTSVVSAKRGQIILVGGGDPYLARKASAEYPKRATISGLARATARRLKHDTIKKVSLGYDSSLFKGPAWNPRWPAFYGDSVSRTSALWVDEGPIGFGAPGMRHRDPAKQAATAFADALSKQGITVTATRRAHAPKSAPVVAKVSSMPLERIVEHLIKVSDNDAAEVIYRQAAIGAGKPGSIAEANKVVRAELSKLGIWGAGMTINDGSGLARQTKVPADSMVKMLRVAAEQRHPELRAVITGLSVAGVEGSLKRRYVDDQSLAARGVVRAKTGTLNKVRSLAGVVRTADGSLLAFAFLINNPRNEYAAMVWLDRVTAAISRCGCR
ncbi:MAG TPA: D-alanyl-D-alanine carboxypeptidase/D-alanyl-D-alanine-endopeptidase [Propionibacteriaceae bacterium]|nr:D-alanyl-D-alanine carboxypeptidase/D-alanyl-D-alanine-endopeptidase [Propionibacteriaceae bacterium]